MSSLHEWRQLREVERALERRMSGQDAVMRPRPRPRAIPLIVNEKSG